MKTVTNNAKLSIHFKTHISDVFFLDLTGAILLVIGDVPINNRGDSGDTHFKSFFIFSIATLVTVQGEACH